MTCIARSGESKLPDSPRSTGDRWISNDVPARKCLMSYFVSIPEKTLEHWASMYISNRFPGAHIWWPTQGDDIALGLLDATIGARGPSQVFVLEIKTSRWLGPTSGHQVAIDTRQLFDYMRRTGPLGRALPAYYVFPLPHWNDSIRPPRPAYTAPGASPLPMSAVTVANGMSSDPTTWWRRRAGDQWFGNWTYVMPASQVGACLAPGWLSRLFAATFLATSGRKVTTSEALSSSAACAPAPLYATRPGWRPNWRSVIPNFTGPPPVLWPDFWTTLLSPVAVAPGIRVGVTPGTVKIVTLDDLTAAGGNIDWDDVQEVAVDALLMAPDIADAPEPETDLTADIDPNQQGAGTTAEETPSTPLRAVVTVPLP